MQPATWLPPLSSGPLEGRRILVTRTEEQAGTFATLLREAGAQVLSLPLLSTRYLDPSFSDLTASLERSSWLVFTSANGVGALHALLAQHQAVLPPGLRIAAVGPHTAQALEHHGWHASLLPPRSSGADLGLALLPLLGPQDRVCWARAREADTALASLLQEAGVPLEAHALYASVPDPAAASLLPSLLCPLQLDTVTFAAASAVRAFAKALGGAPLPTGLHLASIGPRTSEAVRELGWTVHYEASSPSLQSLARALTEPNPPLSHF